MDIYSIHADDSRLNRDLNITFKSTKKIKGKAGRPKTKTKQDDKPKIN